MYNLGAQSHVQVSFEQPEYTANVDGLGTLRLLEAVRDVQGASGKEIKFYQAGTRRCSGRPRRRRPRRRPSTPVAPTPLPRCTPTG